MRKTSTFSSKEFNCLLEQADSILGKDIDNINRIPLKEASFRAGKAYEVTQKIANVLSRRLGSPIGLSPVEEKYSSDGKHLDGYFAFLGNVRGLRFNYLKGKSDVLFSIDIFNSIDDLVPEVTVNLNGFNIVQVIDMVVDVINGEWHRYSESVKGSRKGKLQEKITLVDMIIDWLDNDTRSAQAVERGSFNYDKDKDVFLDYIRNNFASTKKDIKPGAFQHNVHKGIETGRVSSISKNQANSVPNISVQKSKSGKELLNDPELQKLYDEVFDDESNFALELMQQIEDDARLIANFSPLYPGMFLHGKAGVGKTQTITDVFKEEGVRPVMIDTAIGRWNNFLQIVNDNATDKIIVFDDNDSVLENDKVVGLLKKLLDSKPVRKINIEVHTKLADDRVIEGEIVFTSKIVFVSNYTPAQIKKNPHLLAIKSRLGAFHYLNYDVDQIISIIRQKITRFAMNVPNATEAMVNEVLDFIEEIQPIVEPENFDMRIFNICLGYRVAVEAGGNTSAWKKRTMRKLHAASTEI